MALWRKTHLYIGDHNLLRVIVCVGKHQILEIRDMGPWFLQYIDPEKRLSNALKQGSQQDRRLWITNIPMNSHSGSLTWDCNLFQNPSIACLRTSYENNCDRTELPSTEKINAQEIPPETLIHQMSQQARWHDLISILVQIHFTLRFTYCIDRITYSPPMI